MQNPSIDLKELAIQVRRDVLRMVAAAQSGHPGGALGAADFLVALYFGHLRHCPHPFEMEGKNEDLFFLSNGHLSALWYSVLARSGYFPISELASFRKINSRLQGHPATAEHLEGIRVASGSLGQGLSVAIGVALSKKLNQDQGIVYCMCGDGELQEGQIWEAVMYAGAKKVDQLVLVVDWTGQQIDGSTEQVLDLGDLKAKFEAFGWGVDFCDGHDLDEIVKKLQKTRELSQAQKPQVILLKTVMGKGVDFMEDTHHWHGKAPSSSELERALAQLPSVLEDF